MLRLLWRWWPGVTSVKQTWPDGCSEFQHDPHAIPRKPYLNRAGLKNYHKILWAPIPFQYHKGLNKKMSIEPPNPAQSNPGREGTVVKCRPQGPLKLLRKLPYEPGFCCSSPNSEVLLCHCSRDMASHSSCPLGCLVKTFRAAMILRPTTRLDTPLSEPCFRFLADSIAEGCSAPQASGFRKAFSLVFLITAIWASIVVMWFGEFHCFLFGELCHSLFAPGSKLLPYMVEYFPSCQGSAVTAIDYHSHDSCRFHYKALYWMHREPRKQWFLMLIVRVTMVRLLTNIQLGLAMNCASKESQNQVHAEDESM